MASSTEVTGRYYKNADGTETFVAETFTKYNVQDGKIIGKEVSELDADGITVKIINVYENIDGKDVFVKSKTPIVKDGKLIGYSVLCADDAGNPKEEDLNGNPLYGEKHDSDVVTNPDGSKTKREIKEEGGKFYMETTTTQPNGYTVVEKFELDGNKQGRLVSRKEIDAKTGKETETKYDYGENGKIKAETKLDLTKPVKDAKGNIVSYDVISVKSYEYDNADHVTKTTTTTHDENHNPTFEIEYPDNSKETQTSKTETIKDDKGNDVEKTTVTTTKKDAEGKEETSTVIYKTVAEKDSHGNETGVTITTKEDEAGKILGKTEHKVDENGNDVNIEYGKNKDGQDVIRTTTRRGGENTNENGELGEILSEKTVIVDPKTKEVLTTIEKTSSTDNQGNQVSTTKTTDKDGNCETKTVTTLQNGIVQTETGTKTADGKYIGNHSMETKKPNGDTSKMTWDGSNKLVSTESEEHLPGGITKSTVENYEKGEKTGTVETTTTPQEDGTNKIVQKEIDPASGKSYVTVEITMKAGEPIKTVEHNVDLKTGEYKGYTVTETKDGVTTESTYDKDGKMTDKIMFKQSGEPYPHFETKADGDLSYGGKTYNFNGVNPNCYVTGHNANGEPIIDTAAFETALRDHGYVGATLNGEDAQYAWQKFLESGGKDFDAFTDWAMAHGQISHDTNWGHFGGSGGGGGYVDREGIAWKEDGSIDWKNSGLTGVSGRAKGGPDSPDIDDHAQDDMLD